MAVFTGTSAANLFTIASGNNRYDALGGNDTAIFSFKLTDATITYSSDNEVIVDTATSHTVLTGFQKYQFTDGTVDESDGSPLVADLFYYAQNHDVWAAGTDADTHYNTVGWKEGRDPNPFFDTDFYLTSNPDVAAAGINPLQHFHTTGWAEGRDPSPNFDVQAYLAQNPTVAAAHVDPLQHFLQTAGEPQSSSVSAVSALTSVSSGITANGFDYAFYLNQNPDVAASGMDAFFHFQTIGWKEGRNPNAYFDVQGYLAENTDVAAAGINPLDHFHNVGFKEGRNPSPWLDLLKYFAANGDIKAANVDPVWHFLVQGQSEGRVAIGRDVTDTNAAANSIKELSAAGTDTGVKASWEGWKGVTFQITGDSSGGGFAVNATTGVVTVANGALIDYETAPGQAYFVTVQASKLGETHTQQFKIVVTDDTTDNNADVPVITSNGGGNTATVSVAENGTAVTTVVATDSDGPTLTYSIIGGADQAKFAINASTGALSFITAPNFEAPTDSDTNNSYIVQVQASDGTFTDTQTITVNVTDVNDSAPANTVPGAQVVTEDVTTPIAGVSVADSDSNVTVTLSVLNGVLNVTGGGVTGNGTTTVTIASANPATVNAILSTLTYKGNANFNGGDTLTIVSSDGTFSDTDTISIAVAAANDVPVAASSTLSATEDATSVQITLSASDIDLGDAVDNFTLGTLPASGTFYSDAGLTTVVTTGAVLPASGGTATLYFKPNANFNGPVAFNYTASDGTGSSAAASVTINVAAVNDAPVADADGPYSVAEDGSLTVNAATGVLAGDTDIDGASLTAALVSGPAHAASFTLNADGSFNYTPAANFSGADTFAYRAFDGTAFSDPVVVTINVTSQNDAPVTASASTFSGAEDSAYNGALPAASDVDGNALTYALFGAPTNGSVVINPNGTFTFTPTANFNGNATFQYVANDGTTDSAPQTVTINFAAVNDAPVADADGPYSVAEDGSLSVNVANGVLAGDTDVEGSSLTASLLFGPAHATSFTLNTDGSFSYTPAANFTGSDTFTYRAFDGTAFSDPVVITINVTAQNDAPVTAPASSFSGTEDNAYNGQLPSATDAEGSALTYALFGTPTNGSVVVNPNGTFTFTPTGNFNGNATFQYVANDGAIDSAPQTVTPRSMTHR